jgi:hypothetical protein
VAGLSEKHWGPFGSSRFRQSWIIKGAPSPTYYGTLHFALLEATKKECLLPVKRLPYGPCVVPTHFDAKFVWPSSSSSTAPVLSFISSPVELLCWISDSFVTTLFSLLFLDHTRSSYTRQTLDPKEDRASISKRSPAIILFPA